MMKKISDRIEAHRAQLTDEVQALETAFHTRLRDNRPVPESVVSAYRMIIDARRGQLARLPR